MSEKLTFHEIFRNCSAVHYNEWSIFSIAIVVDRFRYQFLSRTAFTGDQDARPAVRHPLNHVENLANLRTIPNDVMKGIPLLEFALQPIDLKS